MMSQMLKGMKGSDKGQGKDGWSDKGQGKKGW